MISNRSYLEYWVSIVSRFMKNHVQVHWEDLKCVMRYLNGSLKHGLKCTNLFQKEDNLEDFVDSYYADNVDTRKSISVFVFMLFGATIRWKGNSQSLVRLSNTQVKYITLIKWDNESICVKGIIEEVIGYSRMFEDKLW